MAFPNNCNPRIITVDPSTGCSLTRASIRGMTKQDFEDQGFKEVGMDRIIQRSREARAAGVRESTLESLLMSRMANIKGSLIKQPIGPNESVILPFIYRRQKRNIQSNYWNVVGAVVCPGANANGIPASAIDLSISNSVSPYASPLVDLHKYFIAGRYLMVETISSDKVALSLQYKIITSAPSADPKVCTVTVEPNYSAAGWAALSAEDKAVYRPAAGIAFVLQNSTSDYEKYEGQDVAENTMKLLTFWLQTTRETHKYSDEYLKALNAALMSGYFKDFRQLPLAEQKRIQHEKWTRDWLNSVFYGQRINENQTDEGYRNLPQVVDPNNEGCPLEFKANALGFKTQLADCGRVLDMQGGPLNLDALAQMGYDMKRARQASGGTIDRIDIGTDRWTAGAIHQIFIQFYKAKYGTDFVRYYQPDQKLEFDGQTVLKYNVYPLPQELGGYELAVYTDEYFDDKLVATPAATKTRSRTIWGIDWSDFVLGVGATNSAARQTNIYDNLYNTVITPNIQHYQLNSTTFTVIVEDPARHYIVDNFSDASPVLTVPGVDLAK